jgi:ABC-2 type transport system permease protein
MSATATTPDVGRLPIGTALGDIGVMTRRNLTKILRSPQLIIFSTIQPIMFVLLFNYVFGGAISDGFPPGIGYIDYLLPGIFAQTALFGSTNTGIVLNEELRTGVVDRFRSLPMARSAVLAGRTIADSTRQTFVVLLMVAVGYLIGFRFRNGLLPAIGAILLIVGFGFAFAWISANIGLRAKTAEVAQTAGFIWVFPLVFASSAFVPTQTMPSWLQVWAENQPVSVVINAVRGLILGPDVSAQLGLGDVTTNVLVSLAWIVGLVAVAGWFAVRGYRKVA